MAGKTGKLPKLTLKAYQTRHRMIPTETVKVLFVCMGNICRSPMAHWVFANRVKSAGIAERITIDSAGTHAYLEGEQPDIRAREAALRRGLEVLDHRARRICVGDFEANDYIFAMDRGNYEVLLFVCPPAMHHKIHLYLDFTPQSRVKEIHDPYGGGEKDFEKVLTLLETGAEGILQDIRSRHLYRGSLFP
jgi:protein-tyrosine phosphatase